MNGEQSGTTARGQTGAARRASKAAHRDRKSGPVLSVTSAAAYLDVSKWTVYRRIEEGALPAFVLNGRTRIYQSDLDAFIARAAS